MSILVLSENMVYKTYKVYINWPVVLFFSSYGILMGLTVNTGIGPVKRQFLNVELIVLHCCAARFSFVLTFIHRLN